MVKFFRKCAIKIALCLSPFLVVVNGESIAVSDEAAQIIKSNIQKSMPAIKVEKIIDSPIKGLYQVSSGPYIFYVSEDGHYAVIGNILDLQDGKTNATEQARQKGRVDALNALGEQNMVVYKAPKEKAKYTVTVFTDIDCGYCRKFHSHISELNDRGITVRYVAFPRSGKKSADYNTMLSIWCSDPSARKDLLTKAKNGETIPDKQCKTDIIEKQLKLGVLSGIQGTPSIIFEDGSMVGGYLTPDQLWDAVVAVKERK